MYNISQVLISHEHQRKSGMSAPARVLSFCWWNLHDFAHHDKDRSGLARWPKSREEYEAKKGRTLQVIRDLFPESPPDLLAVCETTRMAANDMSKSLPGGYTAVTADPSDHKFQVAVLHRKSARFVGQFPILPPRMSDETRPMIPIHFKTAGHEIMFVACHWPSFDEEDQREARQDLAAYLRTELYKFLHGDDDEASSRRHVVVLGDLNEEPTERMFVRRLPATRDRASSQRRAHRRDAQVSRVRLYNVAWRFLGEQTAYSGGDVVQGSVGTFYSPRRKVGWRTFDHVLISGGLLESPAPYLDETSTKVVITHSMRGPDGLPRPFDLADGLGASDHLPIIGQIVLPEGDS